MSNWNKRIRAAREAQKMTREMVVQKMQQFLPESEKAVTTRALMSWEAGEREPRVTVGVALAKALGFEDVAVLYLDSEPKLNQAGQQRLGEYRSMLLHTAEFTEKPEPLTREEKKAWVAQLKDVALGSDAFFPFGDNIERAHRSGVQYIAQAGGSIRDDNVIETCDKYGIAMAFTGLRLFHH